MSQKAAELDELNDQLTEERKRSRDLQWAVEKERCRTGRDEERKREELEVGFGFSSTAAPLCRRFSIDFHSVYRKWFYRVRESHIHHFVVPVFTFCHSKVEDIV